MFAGLRDKTVTMALNGIKNVIIEQYLENIGKVEEIYWKNGHLFLKLKLDGLDQPVECECFEIHVASDGSAISVGKFFSNIAFMETALNRFVAGRTFELPPGAMRLAVKTASKILGL